MTTWAIVPAAGQSRRMGTCKLLLPWGHSTVLATHLKAWRDARLDRVLVVIRSDRLDLIPCIQAEGGEPLLANPAPLQMLNSVQFALRHVQAEMKPNDPCLIAPADHPALAPRLLQDLLQQQRQQSGAWVPVFQGRRGHPLLITGQSAQYILDLGPDASLRDFLRSHPPLHFATTDPGCITSFNTLAEWQTAHQSYFPGQAI